MVGPIRYDAKNPSNYLDLSSFAIPCAITAAAATAPTGTDQDCVPGTRHYGNEGRDSLRGPSFKEFNFAVYKTTAITERLNMQFRADFFNLPNHPNFANPDGNYTDGPDLFGHVTSVKSSADVNGDPQGGRAWQLAGKFYF